MIGICGGTFDPIHYGHLRAALDVQQALGLTQVRFIPLSVAVHREQPHAEAAQRMAMLRAALAGQPGFVADDREMRRTGRSYTLHTLRELSREYPDTPLCLFIGGDAFSQFLSWHQPREILRLAHLVVMQRPGAGPPGDPRLVQLSEQHRCGDPRQLTNTTAGSIYFHTVTQLDISSTRIRELLAQGASPRFLLPDPVLEIIERQRLYRGNGAS